VGYRRLRPGAVAPRPARVLEAAGYTPLGTVPIAGWDWLRATDARVEWTFDTTPGAA